MSSTLKIVLQHIALDQCEVMVNGRRVAYICYGKKKPINYLPKGNAGAALTIEEKIVVARFVREAMEKLTQARDAKREELADLIGTTVDDDFVFEHDPIESSVGQKQKKSNPVPAA